MTSFFILLKKELDLFFARKERVIAALGFAFLLTVVSSFAFRHIGLSAAEAKRLTTGVFWLIFLFIGVVALNTSFLQEKENEAYQGVLLSPVSPGVFYLAKLLANFLFLFGLSALVLFCHSLFWTLLLPYGGFLHLSLFVTLGFCSVGTFLSFISVSSANRELILPLILFPITIPLFVAATYLTDFLLTEGVLDTTSFWFILVSVYSVIGISLGLLLFEELVYD